MTAIQLSPPPADTGSLLVEHDRGVVTLTLNRPDQYNALSAALSSDADELVRHEAAEALGEHRDQKARDALTSALQDPSPLVRETAAIALKQIERALASDS